MPEHGGDLLGFAARYGKREEEILDFSSNINPLGPSEQMIRLYHHSIEDLSRYPDADARPFVQKISECFPASKEEIIAGNGSMEILTLAVRALKPVRAVIAEPCFGEYRALLEKEGAEVHAVSFKPENDFQFPLVSLLRELQKVELLILGHPNNPTGNALLGEDAAFLLREARRSGVFVIVDEAFADWYPEISFASEVRKGGLLVVRSLTKFFALAGIRSGFGLGPADLIRKMKNAQGPWSCNRLAQKLSVAALEDLDFQVKSRFWLQSEKEWLKTVVENLGTFKVFPSLANFLLVQSKQSVAPLLDFLGQQGVYVRQIREIQGFEDSFFRIAVRTRQDNERLVHALQQSIAPAGIR